MRKRPTCGGPYVQGDDGASSRGRSSRERGPLIESLLAQSPVKFTPEPAAEAQ